MVSIAEFRRTQALAMLEDPTLREHIRAAAAQLAPRGLEAYHTHDSRRSSKGYPDWVFGGPGGMAIREVKRQCRCKPGRKPCPYHPTPKQQTWLDFYAAQGVDTGVWMPSDWLDGTITATLTRLATPVPRGLVVARGSTA